MSVSGEPLTVVLSQIRAAKKELDAYPPNEFDWYARSRDTATLLVPWVVSIAPSLKCYVEEVLAARVNVRRIWREIKTKCGAVLPTALVSLLDKQLDREAILLSYVGGNIISGIIENYLVDRFTLGTLESNGKSDYPDLFLRSKSYVGLPKFKRTAREYGAALKGKNRPVRVPDGLEIKTCRDHFAVDCHYPHAGLHLALIHHASHGGTVVDDVLVAFMRKADYRITRPRTRATTLKSSFNGENFISVL